MNTENTTASGQTSLSKFGTLMAGAFLALATGGFSDPVHAGEFVFGLGADNIDANGYSEKAALQLEYHSDALRSYSWGSVSGIGVFEFDEDDDVYLGAGLSALWNLSSNWFFEGSLAAGYYDAGDDGLDLGGDVQFRTLIGVGYRISGSARLSLAVDHLSNAGLEDTNPGRDAVFLRYARSF